MQPTTRSHVHGAALMLVATLMFAAVAASVKAVKPDVPNEVVVFFRNFFGLLALLPFLLRRGMPSLRTRRLPLHLFRVASGLSAMYCFFFAIGKLSLAEAVLLNYSSPLFIPFIALFWLGESPPRNFGWAIVVGFVGIALILKPGLELFSPYTLVGLAAGVFAGVAFVTIRRLGATEPSTRTVFYFVVTATLVSAVPLAWAWYTPTLEELAFLALVGTLGTAGQLCMTRAYALAPAARVGPFTYATVVFAALLGWAFWQEVPDLLSAAGALLVSLAGVIAIRSMGRKAVPVSED